MEEHELKVARVEGKVRLDLGNGTWMDLWPDQANKLSGLLLRAAHEAVYNDRPTRLTPTFNFED